MCDQLRGTSGNISIHQLMSKDGVDVYPPDVIELQKTITEQRVMIAEQRETIEYLEREIKWMQKTLDDEFG